MPGTGEQVTRPPGGIGAADVADLGLGAGVLAAGVSTGAGAVLAVRDRVERGGPVPVVSLAQVDATALVVTLGVIAAERGWPSEAALAAAVHAVEERAGVRCAAVLPLAVGGAGALAAVHAAALLDTPCVDADGAGLGRVDLTLFGLGGVLAAPVVVAADGAEVVCVRSPDNAGAQRVLAAVATALTGPLVVCAYPMTGAECAALARGGAVGVCLRLGAALRVGRFPVVPLFTGEVVHLVRDPTPPGVRGTATIESADHARTLRLDFQSGHLVATEDGVVHAAVPDLITPVDTGTWLPVAAADLAVGRRVHVLVFRAPARWRQPDGLAAAGPRRFGYDIDHGSAGAEPESASTVGGHCGGRAGAEGLHPLGNRPIG